MPGTGRHRTSRRGGAIGLDASRAAARIRVAQDAPSRRFLAPFFHGRAMGEKRGSRPTRTRTGPCRMGCLRFLPTTGIVARVESRLEALRELLPAGESASHRTRAQATRQRRAILSLCAVKARRFGVHRTDLMIAPAGPGGSEAGMIKSALGVIEYGQ